MMQLQYCFGLHYILFLSCRGCGEDAPNLSSFFHHLSLSGPAVHQIGRLACSLSFLTSLQHLCLSHVPAMFGQEASDGSVTPLSWHLLSTLPLSLPMSSSRQTPQCLLCLPPPHRL